MNVSLIVAIVIVVVLIAGVVLLLRSRRRVTDYYDTPDPRLDTRHHPGFHGGAGGA
jgi:uncharacterized membrane-anchored protein